MRYEQAGYEQLVSGAMAVRFEGWDWSVFRGRFSHAAPSWDYREIAATHARQAAAMLDLGTGGGELLSTLAPLPARTVATEGHPPNVPVARRNLAPLGVEVVDTSGLAEGQLPLPDGTFDLVLSRHEAYQPTEVWRVLRPGGWFVTQQVGGQDVAQLNAALGAPAMTHQRWDLTSAADDLVRAGFAIGERQEEHLPGAFHDLGAVVLFLRVTPWQIPDFYPAGYEARLRALHASMSAGTPLQVTAHRFLLTGRRA